MALQLNRQSVDASLLRRFETNDCMLRYKRIDSLFYTDTFFSKKVVSKRGYSMMQLFVSDKGFVKVYGMKSQTEFANALKLFCKEVGAPTAMIVDPHRSQKKQRSRAIPQQGGNHLARAGRVNTACRPCRALHWTPEERSWAGYASQQLPHETLVLCVRASSSHHDLDC